jgi:tryptophanyl-tRNA synthetase
VVFTYLDAFDDDRVELDALKDRCRRGGLGDVAVKRRLEDILQATLAPIRERRATLARDTNHLLSVLQQGTQKARLETQTTLDEVRDAIGLFRLSR